MATVANYIRARAVPLSIAGGIFGLLWWQTRGGKSQPRAVSERYSAADTGNLDMSEKLQKTGGTGGPYARREPLEEDPKDTRVVSHSPDTYSKRTPAKTGTEPEPHSAVRTGIAPEVHSTGAGRKDNKDYGGNKV